MNEAILQGWERRFGSILASLMLAQVKALDSIRADSQRLPLAGHAITAHIKQNSPPAGPDGKRWAVRGIPINGGRCSTAGVFSTKDDACEFLKFWGTFVNTEVKLAEIDKGIDPWEDGPLDQWEQHWMMRRPPSRINHNPRPPYSPFVRYPPPRVR